MGIVEELIKMILSPATSNILAKVLIWGAEVIIRDKALKYHLDGVVVSIWQRSGKEEKIYHLYLQDYVSDVIKNLNFRYRE